MHSQITEVTESHDKIYFVMLTSVANTCQQKMVKYMKQKCVHRVSSFLRASDRRSGQLGPVI